MSSFKHLRDTGRGFDSYRPLQILNGYSRIVRFHNCSLFPNLHTTKLFSHGSVVKINLVSPSEFAKSRAISVPTSSVTVLINGYG